MAVTNTDHTNNGNLSHVIPGALILTIVVIKFIAPNIEDIPAKCKLTIAISTDPPECPIIPANGGYTVQPVPAPSSTNDDPINIINAGGNNQKLILFNRGNAISGAPMYIGTNQFPKPPINTGITKKNIAVNACAVTNTLYNWSSPNILPGPLNSIRIIPLKPAAISPDIPPNIIYNVPISL